MKSANWISATGRRPLSAIPIAIPTIPDSASGVSKTLSSPKRSHSPSVARKTPPLFPISSPRRTTAGFRSISFAIASWSAWMSVRVAIPSPLRAPKHGPLLCEVPGDLGVYVFQQRLRGDRRGGFAILHRARDLLSRLFRKPLRPLVVQDSESRKMPGDPPERVFLPPGVALLLCPVPGRIVRGGMRPHPVGDGLDERRAAPGARLVEGVAGDLVDGQQVVAVHANAVEPVGGRFPGDRGRSRLLRERKGDRILVVASEKNHM